MYIFYIISRCVSGFVLSIFVAYISVVHEIRLDESLSVLRLAKGSTILCTVFTHILTYWYTCTKILVKHGNSYIRHDTNMI